MNNLSGQQLGNYRLVRLLGQGGFADVYLGEHVFLKTHAAIKVLHTQVTPENMGSFVAEAQNIARLHHPHIIRVLDFGVENNMPFLVMDYAPKGTLRQRHPRGSRLPLWMVVGYVRQIADALNYAHSQRLIHRDIKPENMLLGPNDEILISDFGIATMAQSSHYQITQDVVGTVAYMAPEQIQGKPRPVSDEYALAITIYEWLTGSCPFQGSFTEIATQHVFAQPAPLREKLPGISPDVEQVIMMALAKDPLQRFANLKAFAIALEQASGVTPDLSSDSLTFIPPGRSGPTLTPVLSQGELLTDISAGGPAKNPTPVVLPAGEVATRLPTPTPVPPATTGASASRPRSRVSRRMFIGGAGLLVVLSSGALAWYGSAFLRSYANHGGFTPTIPAHVATPVTPVATATATPTATPSPTPSPTPTQPPPTPTQPPPTPTPQPTSPPVSPALVTYQGPSKMYTVSWSPNGTKIASAGLGPNIEVWSATTGSDYFKCYSGSSIIYSTAWSPNGSYLVSGHDDGSIQFWDGNSGNHLFSISAHSRQVNSVAWSPDGSKVVSGSGDKTAKIWDVTTGNLLLTYTNHTSYVNTVSWSHNGNLIASGGGGGTVHVWSSSTGSDSYIYSGHSSVILATAWSLDDSRIVSVSQDTTGRVWSSTDGTTYVIYSGHNDYIVAVAWSPDGSYIASGSKDNTVQVWGAASGHRYHLYNGHSNEVEGVAWSPDSSKVVSASDDTTVQVWKAVS